MGTDGASEERGVSPVESNRTPRRPEVSLLVLTVKSQKLLGDEGFVSPNNPQGLVNIMQQRLQRLDMKTAEDSFNLVCADPGIMEGDWKKDKQVVRMDVLNGQSLKGSTEAIEADRGWKIVGHVVGEYEIDGDDRVKAYTMIAINPVSKKLSTLTINERGGAYVYNLTSEDKVDYGDESTTVGVLIDESKWADLGILVNEEEKILMRQRFENSSGKNSWWSWTRRRGKN